MPNALSIRSPVLGELLAVAACATCREACASDTSASATESDPTGQTGTPLHASPEPAQLPAGSALLPAGHPEPGLDPSHPGSRRLAHRRGRALVGRTSVRQALAQLRGLAADHP